MAEEKTQEAQAKGTNTPKDGALARSQTSTNPIEDLYIGLTEGTYFRSPMVADSYKPPYNPDDLWQKRGDYSIYETMVQDDQVSVCLQLKKDLVLGDGGSFVPGEEGQDEIVEDLETAFLEDYEGDFMEDVEQICTAYEFGLSLTEKVFKVREGQRIGPKCLRTRHPNSWRLYQDDKGKVTKYEQVTAAKGDTDVNPKSLIHYINNPRFQNPYGTSDLRAAYNAWFTKTNIVRYMGIFLEKAASPIPVAKYDKNAPQAAVDKVFEAMKKFQTKTALAIPKDIDAEFLEAKNNGDVYVKSIHLFNMFIGRSLFIPDLVGFTGGETGGGSLALGKEQMNLFFKHIIRRRNMLEALINKELVWPTVMYNWGFVKKYPKWKFKPLDDMQAVELAKVWLEAVKGKTYKPNPEEINHFRKLVKFPEGEVEFLASAPNPMDPNDPNKPQDPKDPDGDKNDDKAGQNAKPGEEKTDKENPQDKNKDAQKVEKKEFGKAYNHPDGTYHKKVNFKAIETKLNDYDNSLIADTNKIVKKIISDLMDQIEKKKIVQGAHQDRIETLSLKYKKELKQVLKSSFMQIYLDAQSQAAQEVDKSNYARPLADDKFLELIESETFSFVGDYEYGILKRVRLELMAAIRDGKPLSSVQGVLDRDLRELSEVQLERFARTKHTELLNNGRLAFFEGTGVVTGYQYSAVLDDRTSDICSGLHGKKFAAGDEPIPPLHFNCRSLLIPITKYEEFKPSEVARGMPIDEFIEENKGVGFATK